MKIKLQFPRIWLRKLLLGIVVFSTVSGISTAQSQANLASAYELTFNKPPNQMDVYVSIKLKEAKVKELLDAIEGKSGFKFVYDKSVLGYDASFTLKEDKIRLYRLLQKVSNESDLRFKQVNNNINVRLIESIQIVSNIVEVTVTGTVVDQNGNPIPGATVSVPGLGIGTATDIDGKYSITVPDGATLVFSFVGFDSQSIAVGDKSVVDVTLNEDISSLEEVVVVGYGTQRRRDLTGAVSQIKAEQLENENPNTVQDILRGNITGLNIGYNASAKGGGSLQVRGRKSLNAGGEPLIVLDGIIYYGQLADINPSDIESIDVLKDASSTAIYGAKAANGVVIISTKKGKTGKPVINFNNSIAIATMGVHQPIHNAEGYLSFREDVMKSMNENHRPFEYSDPRALPSNISTEQWLAYDASGGNPVNVWLQRLNMKQVEIDNYNAERSINWYDRVFQNGFQQDYNVSISNSTDAVSYFWSLGTMDNEGIIVGDKFNTIRSRLNLDAKITDFLNVGINAQFSDRDESQVPVAWTQMVNVSPWGSEFADDGTTLRLSPQDDPAVTANPFLNPAYTDRRQKYTSLFSTFFAKISLPLDITYQLNFSPNFDWYNYLNHQSSEHPTWGLQGGIATRTQSLTYRWQLDNLLKWQKTINDIHNFDVTLLANSEKFQTWHNSITNNNFDPTDQLGYHHIGVGTNPIVSSNDEYSTGDALMARLFYSLKDRYMITASIRRDGYSAFGQQNARATFPSLALGWVFTDENFGLPEWFSYGKLRLSYGINGNRDIGRYAALSRLSSGNYLHVQPDGTIVRMTTLQIATMSNVGLRWERTASFNVGMDFSILDNILEGSIEAYDMSTTDLLVERSLPRLVGHPFVMANLGEVKNKGVELNLISRNISRNNFTWGTTVNFSLNRNKIAGLYGDMQDVLDENGNVIGKKEQDDITNRWFIGHAIDEIWDLKPLGVYQTNEADAASNYGVEPGDFKLHDVNNDGIYTDADRQFLGYTEPRFRWALRNDFSLFKNFDFSFMMYSYWGHMGTYNQAKSLGNGYMDRTNAYILPYWTVENPIDDYARLSSNSGSATYDIYREKSFIRLDNISLSYTLPRNVVERVKIQNFKTFFSVRNVGFYSPGTFLWDPENSGPTPRTYTVGFNLTL